MRTRDAEDVREVLLFFSGGFVLDVFVGLCSEYCTFRLIGWIYISYQYPI